MNILVIGGCGYIGAYLAKRLKAAGHTIETLDIQGDPDIRCDYRDVICDWADVVLWFAGVSSVKEALSHPDETLQQNVTGLLRLRRVMHKDAYLIYASSGSVYSGIWRPAGAAIPWDGSPLNPIHPTTNAYDRSKFLIDYINQGGWMPNSLGLRMGTVCGWSDPMRVDTVFNKMSLDALEHGKITVFGHEAWRPLLFLDYLIFQIEMYLEQRPTGILNAFNFNATIGNVATHLAHFYNVHVEDIANPSGPPGYDFRMADAPHVGPLQMEFQQQCWAFKAAWESAGGHYNISWPKDLDPPRVCPVEAVDASRPT